MAAPSASEWVTQWQWSWAGIVLTFVLGGVYGWAWVRARRGSSPQGMPRLVLFFAALALLDYVTCGPIGHDATTYLWIFALRIGLLNAVVPLGLALGKPIDVLVSGFGSSAPRRWATGRVARLLMYPAVSSVLAAVSVLAVFYTGYGQSAATNGVVDALLVVHLLVVGTLVVLPLLGEDMLPAWAGPGMRTLIASLDGLLDALPGILVMTSSSLLLPRFPGFVHPGAARGDFSPSLDQKFAGGALLAVAESIGIPMLIAVFVEWMRHDERKAAETDRALDELDDQGDLTTPWWLQSRDGGER